MTADATGHLDITEPPEVTDAPRAGGVAYIADLTDEEILGIDGPGSEQVAPLPWIGSRSPDETHLAAEVGLRGLVAHGRIVAHEDGLDLPQDLEAALALRHDARSIVYADHSTPATQETRILYVHPHAVLVEEVNAAGVHRFGVGGLGDAIDELGAWATPSRHEGTGRLEGDDLPTELVGLQSVVFLDVVTLTAGGDVDTRSLTFYRLADDRVVEGIETTHHLDLPTRAEEEIRTRVDEAVRSGLAGSGDGRPTAG